MGGLFFDVRFRNRIGISCIAWEQGEDGVDVVNLFTFCILDSYVL